MNLQKDMIEPLSDARDAPRDSVWGRIQREARVAVRDEPLLGALIHAGLLHHATFEAALARQGLSLGDLDVVMTLPTNEAICAALQDQPLASVLSLAVAEPYIAAGRLFELPFMLPERPFSCLSHPLRRKGKLVKSFETYLN